MSSVFVVIQLLIATVFLCIRVVLKPVSRVLQIGNYKKCPPIRNQLLMLSATQLVKMIKNKQVKSEEVVAAFIERCKEVNPILNAIVQNRYDLALDEARKVDQLIASNPKITETKPLLGLPITVKESIAVEGMSHNAGCIRPNGQKIAKIDADCVRQVKEAGAIPIVVSNTPELCMNLDSYNNITGITRNPYDTRRTPSGSSGGEASLISSAASIIGLGSDIGGSLRIPAMYTCIYGHKPSPGVISTKGHFPDCTSSDWYKYFTIGPMVRYADDISLLLKVISDPKGPNLHLDKPVSLKKLNYFYMDDDGGSFTADKVDTEISDAFHKAISYLESELNVKVQKVSIKSMKKLIHFAVGLILGLEGIDNIYADEENPEKLKPILPELLKYITFSSNYTLSAIVYGPIKKFFDSIHNRENLLKVNAKLQKEFKDLLGDNGIFLYPTFPNVAHFPYESYYLIPNVTYTIAFNTIGLPVTNCPLGLNKDGLPMGMQIVANAEQDRLTIAVAKKLEQSFGGWIPPTSVLIDK